MLGELPMGVLASVSLLPRVLTRTRTQAHNAPASETSQIMYHRTVASPPHACPLPSPPHTHVLTYISETYSSRKLLMSQAIYI